MTVRSNGRTQWRQERFLEHKMLHILDCLDLAVEIEAENAQVARYR